MIVMINNDRFYKLEMLILSILQCNDYSCFQLKNEILKKSQNYFEIKSGVLLTSLYYMKNAQLISEYSQDDDYFFHIENAGYVRLETLQRQYTTIKQHLDCLLKETHHE